MTSDNNIQRYSILIEPFEEAITITGKWVKYKDHLKAMEAKDVVIAKLSQDRDVDWQVIGSRNKQIRAKNKTIAEQAKEIERLRSENQEMGLFMFMRTHS